MRYQIVTLGIHVEVVLVEELLLFALLARWQLEVFVVILDLDAQLKDLGQRAGGLEGTIVARGSEDIG